MSYENDIGSIWEMVKETLALHMPESAVNLWFGELVPVSFDENTVHFTIPSELKHNIIYRNKYDALLEKCFTTIFGFPVKVKIVFNGVKRTDSQDLIRRINLMSELEESDLMTHREEVKKPEPEPVKPPVKERVLGGSLPRCNFEYTFENFIVGNSNKFVHAACMAVARDPFGEKNFNPLFIYGPSGIGKTHLLYAITNEIKNKNPGANIIYIKGEEFTNQMIESLAHQDMKSFHEKFRSCDVLLIDDVQFIAGKVATQEEFFHTFNALHEENKQIILTSDRPPHEIKTLEDRLKSRFEWGLIADIQPPDLELRIAIIKKKAEQANIVIPEEVLTFLAENLRSNIRQLEGAIKKLAALNFLSGQEITMETTESCIMELLGNAEPASVTVDKIFGAVYKKYGIPRPEIVGKKRNKEIAFARHVANFLIRDITEMSLPNIGKIFDRHYSTVIASIDFVEKRMITDQMFALDIRALKKEVTGVDQADD